MVLLIPLSPLILFFFIADEVFMPKDIDLENGEMDEFEKELEAFKR